jgi:hypothetical protein
MDDVSDAARNGLEKEAPFREPLSAIIAVATKYPKRS